MTIDEAQGVEFDIVCLVGVSREFYQPSLDAYRNHPELFAEKSRITKDLLYVALTRAMNQLYIFGPNKLSEILKGIAY